MSAELRHFELGSATSPPSLTFPNEGTCTTVSHASKKVQEDRKDKEGDRLCSG